MAIGWFAVALLLMLVGLLGAVVPLLPGLPLVLAGVYLYALATGPAPASAWATLSCTR